MWRFVSPFVIQVREADEKEDTVAMPPPQVVLKKGKVLSNLVLVQEIERMEEQKLKSKFPGAPGIELIFFLGVWLRADEDRWQRFLQRYLNRPWRETWTWRRWRSLSLPPGHQS